MQWLSSTLNKIQTHLSPTHLFNKPPLHTEAFSLFFQHAKLSPATGPFHSVSPSPACDTHCWLLPSFVSVQIPALGEAFPDHLSRYYITQFPSQRLLLSEILIIYSFNGLLPDLNRSSSRTGAMSILFTIHNGTQQILNKYLLNKQTKEFWEAHLKAPQNLFHVI